MKVYLDNAATTKVDKKIIKVMNSICYGNPSSLHSFGKDARKLVEDSRNVIAKKINANISEIIFTSSGTFANNLVVFGLDLKGKEVITTPIEHLSVIEPLKKSGAIIKFVKVDKEGYVDYENLEKMVNKNTALVSIIHGNNEIGTIQNLDKIGKICKNVLLHIDAVQSLTKVPIDVKKFNINFLTISSHKIHGPKGIAALYINNEVKLNPIIYGGGQEHGLNSGTENVSSIVGFAEALKLNFQVEKITKLKDYLINELLKIPKTRLNGPLDRLCNNVNITFFGIEAESLLLHLDSFGIAVSTGSACSSKKIEPSKVLIAIGLKPKEANSSIRFSLSKCTTKKELDYVIKKVKFVVEKLRF